MAWTPPTENVPLRYPLPAHPEDPLALNPLYDELLKQPVAKAYLTRSQLWAWLLTRHADVTFVLKNEDLFSREQCANIPGYPVLTGFLPGMDGERRRRVRQVAAGMFTRSRVARLAPRIEHIADRFLNAMIGSGPPADLVAGLTLPLPLDVIGELYGVPAEDRVRFREWGDEFLCAAAHSPERSAAAMGGMAAYMGDLLSQRRTRPADDWLSEMIRRNDGSVTAFEEICLGVAIIVAGWESTASAIASFTYWLLTHVAGDDSYYSLLTAQPELIPDAVEELLRAIPIGADGAQLPRRATRDVVIGGPGGALIRQGDLVIAIQDAANRDPRVFADPERVDLGRNASQHRAFGYGPHMCLGAHLSRAEIQIALRQLARRLPDLCLAVPPNELRWNPQDVAIRGLRGLPVAWGSG